MRFAREGTKLSTGFGDKTAALQTELFFRLNFPLPRQPRGVAPSRQTRCNKSRLKETRTDDDKDNNLDSL